MNETPEIAGIPDSELSLGLPASADASPAKPPRRKLPPLPAQVRGKFLYVGDEKFYAQGVTYGPFCPTADGCEYKTPELVRQDFQLMVDNHVNAVRVYTVPPRWLLDIALELGLRVMVGLPWEQHITFLDSPERVRDIIKRVADGVKSCAGHPAVLCYAIGNEIPAGIIRWYGARRVERFLHKLYLAAKREAPHSLVTYVNFPTTEYLKLPFLDFVCFNVYLETEKMLRPYLQRLQNIAGERPLVMAEVGLDSMRNGEEKQASTLLWQIDTFYSSGCAGGFIFSWTDEWYRGGCEILDWAFGLVTRDRKPKAALEVIGKAYANVPFSPEGDWQMVSVVVCTYNGARTLAWCLEGVKGIDYPNFEVIVVNDGSKDASAQIAMQAKIPNARIITTENRGLSNARNTGWQEARGEIVAYIDDDARPDPHWLYYLAYMFRTTNHAGVGGPNLAPLDSNSIADCVANSPGGPNHVLLTDEEAEHIPGCNMAFRRSCLEAINGFDATFRIAGDDVDLCWRLQKKGWTLGFSPSAMVWHKRRDSVKHYLKQQKNYGKAEAILELKWPEKYNTAGHLSWNGRIYSKGVAALLHWRTARVYHGVWGSALFQSLYEPAPDLLSSLPHIPEFYLVILSLAALSAVGIFWSPLLLAAPLLVIALGAVLSLAVIGAMRAVFTEQVRSPMQRLWMRLLTGYLHIAQPIVRLRGRFSLGLTPWRLSATAGWGIPWVRMMAAWYETWHAAEQRIEDLERALQRERLVVRRGSEYARWDLELRGGLLGGTHLRMAIEEHGWGKQLVRLKLIPTWSPVGIGMVLLFAALAGAAASDHAWIVATVLGIVAAIFALRSVWEVNSAMSAVNHVMEQSTGLRFEIRPPAAMPVTELPPAPAVAEAPAQTPAVPVGGTGHPDDAQGHAPLNADGSVDLSSAPASTKLIIPEGESKAGAAGS